MPRRFLGGWAWIVGLGLLALAGDLCAPQTGQAADGPPRIYHKSRSFRIPFKIEPADRPRLQEVQLWVSQDMGFSWNEQSHTGPDSPAFTFRAPKDGEFWFAVRTLSIVGGEKKLFPPDDKMAEPGMCVVVDTQAPSIDLAPMG